MSGGTLWLVATPIGNLGDLPPRAIEVLSHAGLVCCEDTRRTGRLLQHAGISVERLAVANDHTEHHRIDDVLGVLGGGRDVAVVTLLYGCGLRISEALGLTWSDTPLPDTLRITGWSVPPTERMERRERIEQALRAGESVKAIAGRELVSQRHVRRIRADMERADI